MPIGSKPEQSEAGARPVRPARILFYIGMAAIMALCAATAWVVWQLRAREILDAKRELITLDVLLAEETERSLQSVDLILRDLQEKIISERAVDPAEYQRAQSGQDTHELLHAKITGIPQLESIALIAANGDIINCSCAFPPPPINVSSRDYFKALASASSAASFLGEPGQNSGAANWSIYLARRLTSPDGTFLGIIRGTIDRSYFENLYKALQIGDGAAVSFWRKDGMLLARYPEVMGIGRVLRNDAIIRRQHSDVPQTYSVQHSAGDGLARLFAAVSGKQFPIIVIVGQTFENILLDWRHVATLAIAGALICILAVLCVLWLLAKQFASFEALNVALAERALADSARLEAEDQLRQAQKLEAIGELTGGIAHDFNNLLTAVMGNLELLSRHTEGGDPRLQRWAKGAFEAAKRGATLTQRLLAFSRRQPLNPAPTDIAQLLNSMSDLLNRTLGENIEIQTKLAPHLWPAFVDVNQLDSAILNLAINARDAMEGRGLLLIAAHNVTIDTAQAEAPPDLETGDYILIALSDTGDGIAQDVIDRVFEPFFTTKPLGQGTGLGLSQVYGFVKQTKGQLILESTRGQGTTVKMYLPRASAAPASCVAAPDHGSERDRRVVVLVVEDDDEVRAYTLEAVNGLNHVVREARNAAEALDIIRQDQTIELVLTDVGLPGMNGRELVTVALDLRPDLKILFTSGYARQAIMHDDRLDAGVQLLAKPFTREELAAKIRSVFN